MKRQVSALILSLLASFLVSCASDNANAPDLSAPTRSHAGGQQAAKFAASTY